MEVWMSTSELSDVARRSKISVLFRWFHKNVLRKEAERLLLNASNPRGTFLVRNSENAPGWSVEIDGGGCLHFYLSGPYSLSVRDFDDQRGVHVKHYKIHYSDPNIGYYIATRRAFPSLDDLINYYTSKRTDGFSSSISNVHL